MRVHLECPDGHRIKGSIERVQGTALVFSAEDVPGKELNLDYAGETSIDWDTQESVYEGLERVFECSDGETWKESQLVKIPINKEKKEE